MFIIRKLISYLLDYFYLFSEWIIANVLNKMKQSRDYCGYYNKRYNGIIHEIKRTYVDNNCKPFSNTCLKKVDCCYYD